MGKNWHRLLLLARLALAGATGCAHGYDCAKKYCTRMQSCGEAYYKFTVCHQGSLDRDNDGIPREVLCGDELETMRERLGSEMTAPVPPQDPDAQPPALRQGETVAQPGTVPLAAHGQSCEGKTRCKQMLSCGEARFYLTQCGVSSLDRDRDGVPCEGLCN